MAILTRDRFSITKELAFYLIGLSSGVRTPFDRIEFLKNLDAILPKSKNALQSLGYCGTFLLNVLERFEGYTVSQPANARSDDRKVGLISEGEQLCLIANKLLRLDFEEFYKNAELVAYNLDANGVFLSESAGKTVDAAVIRFMRWFLTVDADNRVFLEDGQWHIVSLWLKRIDAK